MRRLAYFASFKDLRTRFQKSLNAELIVLKKVYLSDFEVFPTLTSLQFRENDVKEKIQGKTIHREKMSC